MCFLPCPQHEKYLDKVWTTHVKIAQNMYIFPRISHLSSNRREQNLALYFQFMTPARKLTHNMKFEHFWMQKDTNFGNTMILRHFAPEKRQKSDSEIHEFRHRHNSSLPWAREMPKSNHERHRFWETALIDPSKNASKVRKVFVFSRNSHLN